MRRCPQSGGDFGSGEAGPGGYGGDEPGDAPAWSASGDSWQNSQIGHNEQNDWNASGQATGDNKPSDEQELSDKLAQVGWGSSTDTPEPQYGW